MIHLLELIHKPIHQLLFYLLLTIVLILIIRPVQADKLWVISGVTYCFFILTNSVISFFALNTWSYFFVSMGFSLVYVVLIAIIVNIFTKLLKLQGGEESAMMFLVIIFHPIALLIAMLLNVIASKLF